MDQFIHVVLPTFFSLPNIIAAVIAGVAGYIMGYRAHARS